MLRSMIIMLRSLRFAQLWALTCPTIITAKINNIFTKSVCGYSLDSENLFLNDETLRLSLGIGLGFRTFDTRTAIILGGQSGTRRRRGCQLAAGSWLGDRTAGTRHQTAAWRSAQARRGRWAANGCSRSSAQPRWLRCRLNLCVVDNALRLRHALW